MSERKAHCYRFLVLVVCVVAAVAESQKPNLKQFEFPPFLSTKDANSATIEIPRGKSCRVSLTVDSPSSFSLDAAAGKGLLALPSDLQLRLLYGRKQVGEKQELLAGSPRIVFPVYPGNYEVLIGPSNEATDPGHAASCEKSKAPQPALILFITDYRKQNLPVFQPVQGTTANFKLDAVTGSAYWTLVLTGRSELLFELRLSPGVGKERMRLQVRTDQDHRYDPDAEEADSTNFGYAFILNPGTYQLEASRVLNEWPPPPAPDIDLTLQLDLMRPAPLPDELRFLANWLKSEQLDKQIEVLDLFRPHATQEKQDGTLDGRYQRIFHSLAILQQLARPKPGPHKRPSTELSADELVWFEAEHGGMPVSEWPSGTNENQAPEMMIVFRPLADREDLEKIESAYTQRWGESFWTRAFRKVSLAMNVPLKNIVGYVPVYCSAQMLVELKPGTVGREGMECMMASFRKTFDVPQLNVPRPGAETLSKQFVLADRVDGFLRSFLPAGATVDYLDKEKDSIEINVRNIRAHVIQGGHDWEKLDIAMLVVPKTSAEWTLNVFVDGALSSGIGSYPPDSQFTKDMEPAYSKALNDYARRLATSFGEYLNGQTR